MKLIGFIMLLLVEATSLADGSIPTSLNDVPLFYSLLNQNPTYHDAAFKAQQAFFLQTGVTPFYDKLNSYVSNKATSKVTYALDEYTPFGAKNAFFVAGTAYTVCVKKQFSKEFRSPFFGNVTHTISVSTTSASTGIRIPFPF